MGTAARKVAVKKVAAVKKTGRSSAKERILAIDVGGTGLKAAIIDAHAGVPLRNAYRNFERIIGRPVVDENQLEAVEHFRRGSHTPSIELLDVRRRLVHRRDNR